MVCLLVDQIFHPYLLVHMKIIFIFLKILKLLLDLSQLQVEIPVLWSKCKPKLLNSINFSSVEIFLKPKFKSANYSEKLK
jgi:hypothetical protein